VSSTVAFTAMLVLAVLVYIVWERADRRKERSASRVMEDLRSMGELVATSLSPSVDPDRCIGSGACVAACPEKSVIALVGGQARLVNPLGCIGHGACASACPVTAIRLVYGTKTRGVELPVVDAHFQTSRAGVYIAGELGGMGLIRNAVIQGRQAAEHIVAGPRRGARADVLDAIVVGAGPAGISATLELMRSGLRVLLLDREGFGGTILHYPRAKVVMTGQLELPIYGKVPGRQLSKEQLVEIWHEIRARTAPPLITGELVTGLAARDDGAWSVITESTRYHAANVVLALGGRGAPQKLGIPGEDLPKIAYRLLEPAEFADKHVLVVGGGNSAVESALALSDHGACRSVAISYRRGEFARCRAENRRRIAAAIASGAVRAHMATELSSIEPDRVTLREQRGQLTTLVNDAVIVQIGGTAPSTLLKSFGLELTTKYGER
jgi:thioredoxin reductase/NAD-dependent dihydropyrimidine dehydrogenase PreA subunit